MEKETHQDHEDEADAQSQSSIQARRLQTFPLMGSVTDSLNFATANDVIPVRVPLERVEIGPWVYSATELEDIELLYELDSSELFIKIDVCGTNGGVPATFRIETVSAASLSLISIVPGSLETMVARLILETEDLISYVTAEPQESSSSDEDGDGENIVDCQIVKMTASVHESGHLRDVLLFLKADYATEVDPDSIFVSPQRKKQTESKPESSNIQVTFLEGLPYWVPYIPWKVYSKKFRIFLQWLIVVYSVFSVIWAVWQLYKHVNVIRVVVEPIILALKYYLSGIMEAFDSMLALFTHWWQHFLSPLNIIRGLLSAPLMTALFQLRTVFSPIFTAVFQCFNNSALKSLVVALVYVARFAGGTLWSLLKVLARPLYIMWRSLMNSQIATAHLDFQNMRIRWVFSLVMNSLRAIIRGILSFAGYTKKEHKRRKALRRASRTDVSTASASPGHRQLPRKHKMPIYYNSPLLKQKIN